jgi:hypothetical protein
MNTMTNKPKTKTKPEPPQEERGIPQKVLDDFLEDKIPPEDKKRVTQVSVGNIFDDNYRVNVWMQEYEKGSVCPKAWIGYSCFLRYHEGMIIDKTVEPKPKKKGFFDD